MTMMHISLLYAGVLGLLLVVLSFNMMKCWVRAVGLGKQNNTDLRRAEALVGSFTDYVPLTILLIVGAEMSGAPGLVIHFLGAGLVIARLLHAFGSNYSRFSDAFRFLGAQLTYLILTVASFSCLFYAMAPEIIL